ncbi:MAG TPA: RluA family pseudouridine synthase [Polyangiales bacterium]|nr:RluA family pseudouridine synthase [Polyangiales bacterium]
MAEAWEIVVAAELEGERIDRFLRHAGRAGSRKALTEQLEAGVIRVNGARIKKGHRLRSGDVVSGPALQTGGALPDPEIPLDLLYEDAALVVVNKAAGMPSHPIRAGERGTLASALVARFPEMAGIGYRPLEPGILHRLDTQTSGVLLAARTARAFRELSLAHKRGELDKRYLALCSGQLQAPQRVEAYLAADRKRVRVSDEMIEGSKPIETDIVSAKSYGEMSLVEVRVPFASRHQVRAQLAALGHPIAGDTLYGGVELPGLTRHFLHASEIEFPHPAGRERVHVKAELPADLQAALETARQKK